MKKLAARIHVHKLAQTQTGKPVYHPINAKMCAFAKQVSHELEKMDLAYPERNVQSHATSNVQLTKWELAI